MELLTVLRVLRRWWLLIVLLPVVSAVTLWLSLRSRPPVYEASVKLQITTPQREDVAVYEEYRYASVRDEITVARENLTEILQGNDVQNQVASQLSLNDEESAFPVAVDTVRDADFVYVTVEAGSPVLAADIANTLVDVAISTYGDLRARPTYAEQSLFAEKLRSAEEDFRAAQERFAEFQAENGAVALEEQLDTYQRLLEQLQLERDRLLLEDTTRAVDPVSEVDRLIDQHQQELDRLTALAPAYNLLQEDVQFARDNYQRIWADREGASQDEEGQPEDGADAALQELQAAEDALADFQNEHGIVSLETELVTYQKLLEQLQLERDRMVLEETTRNPDAVGQVEQLIARRQSEMDILSALVPTHDLLSDELSQAREQYSYILGKYTEAELTAAAVRAANFIQIVEPAQPPTEPASETAMLLFLVIAGSAGFSVLLAFLLEHVSTAVDDSISIDEGDGQSVLGLPILGMIPLMADGRCKPDSREAEAVRQLRTRLSVSSANGKLKALLITSPQPEDGKSVVAANLGVAMATSGARVILVDTDLRAPGLHKWFDRPNLTGLVDWLKTQDEPMEQLLSNLVCDTDIPGLSLLAAGPPPQDPSLLLASEKMDAVIKILRQRFDAVVLDGPPVVVAPDAVILSRSVPSTLLVLSPDRTSRRICRQAISSLLSVGGAPIIGVALNRTFPGTYGYYQYGPADRRGGLKSWVNRVGLSRGSNGGSAGELATRVGRRLERGKALATDLAAIASRRLAGLLSGGRGRGWILAATLVLIVVLIGLIALLAGGETSAAIPPSATQPSPIAPTVTWTSPAEASLAGASLRMTTGSSRSTKEPTAAPCTYPVGWVAHKVRGGDTLASIASAHGISASAVVGANCLTGSDISIGQTVYLPPALLTLTPTSNMFATLSVTPTAEVSPTVCVHPVGWTVIHVVEAGDTLWSLALTHGVTVEEIMAANCLESTKWSLALLEVGRQELYLPPLPQESASPSATLAPAATETMTPAP